MARIKITKWTLSKNVDSQKFFSYIAGGSINPHNHIVKFLALISTKVDTHFEHFDPGISLLGLYPPETCATSPIQNSK